MCQVPIMPAMLVEVAAFQWGQIGLADAGELAGPAPCRYEIRKEEGRDLEQVGAARRAFPCEFRKMSASAG